MNNIEVKTIYGRIEDFENNYFFSPSISKRKTVGRQTYYVRRYFNGGGHKNAAGGKSFVSMQETIDHYIKSVKEFAQDGYLG